MAVTDFLSGGTIPAGSAVVDVTTQQAIPDWYTNYAKQLLANQQALSAQAPLLDTTTAAGGRAVVPETEAVPDVKIADWPAVPPSAVMMVLLLESVSTPDWP